MQRHPFPDRAAALPTAAIQTARPDAASAPSALEIKQARKAVSAFSLLWTLIFVGPNAVLFTIFIVGPILAAFGLSLFQWDLITAPQFIGLDNFAFILQDSRAINSIWRTGYLLVAGVIPTVILAFLLANLINTRFPGYSIFRTFYLLPIVISFVASAVLWRFIYDPRVGALNAILGYFGVEGQNWLQDTFWAMPAVSLVIIWMRLPLAIILYLAALQQISPQQLEAAEIDGATTWQKLRHVILPNVKPVTFLVVVITVNGIIFESFDVIRVMTGGGPLRSTEVLIIYIYEMAFGQLRLGYASALATVLFVIVAALALLFTPPRRRIGARP